MCLTAKRIIRVRERTDSAPFHSSSDRRLSAKLLPTFAERGMSRGQREGSLRPYSRISKQEPLFFLSSSSSIVLTRTPFQTHYFSENLVAQRI
jgi:hypothetical protein